LLPFSEKMVAYGKLFGLLAFSLAGSVSARQCKAIPGSPGWPSRGDWQQFNETLGGRLLDPSPPAAVCHPDRPEFNEAACAVVTENWFGSKLHADDPISPQWSHFANDSCLPDPTVPCLDEGFPEFAVNATTAEHVSLAINFARKNNIRLIVKNTGHDYLGRSTAGYSLSIWTHHMAEMAFETEPWTPKGCKSCAEVKHPRAVLGAGVQFGNVYGYLDTFNHTIVGGSGMTVGLGGFLTGGGHGILSGARGLGSDQVLEVEMVTPQGKLITLNECQNKDLFWAVRGGGGSTYGVITRFVLRAWPTPAITAGQFSLSVAPNSTAALGLGPLVLTKLPEWMERGITGYLWTVVNGPDMINIGGTIGGTYGVLVYEGDEPEKAAELEQIWQDIAAEARSRWGNDSVSLLHLPTVYPSFFAYLSDNRAKFPAGVPKFLDTRLMGSESLREETPELYETHKCAGTRGPNDSLNVMLVSGKGVHEARPRGGDSAVHPFWRKSAVLLGVDSLFEQRNPAATQKAIEGVNRCMAPLHKLEPDSGAYSNEVSPYPRTHQRINHDSSMVLPFIIVCLVSDSDLSRPCATRTTGSTSSLATTTSACSTSRSARIPRTSFGARLASAAKSGKRSRGSCAGSTNW
jgi:hypothetical protein